MTNTQAMEIAMKAIDEAYEKEQPLLYLLPAPDEVEEVDLIGTINMKESEGVDICDYETPMRLHTIGFVKVFGREAMTIALKSFEMIREKYGSNADYMISFTYVYPNGDSVDFRIINDREAVTILLPCEN